MPLDQVDIDDDYELPDEYRGKLPTDVPKSADMSFIDHLDVLRKHLWRSVLAVFVCALVVGVFITSFFDGVILAPTKPDFITFQTFCRLSEYIGNDLLCIDFEAIPFQNRKLGGQFTMHITLSITMGVIIAFPILIFQLWQFIKPALHKNEKQTASGIVFFCSLLFFLGVAFAYYLVMPLTYNFLINYQIATAATLKNDIDISSYISMFVDLHLACGLMFQLPVFVLILSKLGIVNPGLLIQYRKHAIIVIFVLAAVLTPSDVISMVLVALPLLILYEVSIVISRRVETKRSKESLS